MLHPDRQKYLSNKEMTERLNALELENDYLKNPWPLFQRRTNNQRESQNCYRT